MKKWGKRLLKLAVLVSLCAVLAQVLLHVISRTEWFTRRVESVLKSSLSREVDLGRIGAGLRGVWVENIRIAEKDGFEQGVFVQAGRLRIRFSLLHLLHGHTKVNLLVLSDAKVKLTAYADGTASWDDLTAPADPSAPQAASSPTGLRVTARRVRLENLHLTYVDEKAPRTLSVSGVTLEVDRFVLGGEFVLKILATFTHQEPAFTREIPLTLHAVVNLQQLDLERAYVHIKALKTYYHNSTINLQGRVENFVRPQADLHATVQNLSSKLLEGVATVPPFELPQAQVHIKLAAAPEAQSLTLHQVALQAPGVGLTGKGGLLYKDKLAYDATATVTLILGEIGRWMPSLAEPYRLVGTVQSEVTATHQQARAQITLADLGGLVPNVGRISDVNGGLDITESMDFKTGQLSAKLDGKVNANPFTLNLQATQSATQIQAVLDAYAKEFLLLASPEKAPADETPIAQTSGASPHAWPLPPVALKANVQVEKLDVPYFAGNDILFTSDVAGLTPDLNQAHGTLRLTTGAGTIQDIYKLTNANPLTKVLFMSLSVTGKVFNTLNVLGVLNSLGSGMVSALTGGEKEETKAVKTQTILGPDGEPLEVVVEETAKDVSGKMDFDKFDTEVNFVRGLATIKEGTFVSPTLSFRLDGTTDFNSGALDMDVHAAPGRHEVDGMMPLHVNIGGTLDDPQGSMQVLGSVASLVTQSVTNNVVSRQVTKGIKGLFGLFKKDKDPSSTPETSVP